jgi:hypothetical protein
MSVMFWVYLFSVVLIVLMVMAIINPNEPR